MRLGLRAPFVLLALLAVGPSLGAQSTAAAKLATQVCSACHGPKGESISPAFPKLAGQQADYIQAQLKAFRDRSRGDPMAQAFMWGMASQLSDSQIAELAAYYAAQKPPAGKPGDPKLTTTGRAIYADGIPSANVMACATCHLEHGEGNTMIPRVAGQHVEYVVKQLVMFKSELRAGAFAPIMHTNTTGLTFEQMEAVAAYVASQ
jgi:cytochrome c553